MKHYLLLTCMCFFYPYYTCPISTRYHSGNYTYKENKKPVTLPDTKKPAHNEIHLVKALLVRHKG